MPDTLIVESTATTLPDNAEPEPTPTAIATFTPRTLSLEFLRFLDGLVTDLVASNGGWADYVFSIHNGEPSVVAEQRSFKPRNWNVA